MALAIRSQADRSFRTSLSKLGGFLFLRGRRRERELGRRILSCLSHVFRTFQGWLALTEQGPSDGTLQLIPNINSMAYILTRALLDDVPNNSLCGSMPGRALSVNPEYHSVLLRALVSIPKVYPGDAVWWHPDVVHAVEDKHHGKN